MIKWLSKLRKKSSPAYISGWNGNSTFVNVSDGDFSVSSLITPASSSTDTREAKKPVEIYQEILTEMPTMDLSDLKGKIKLVQRRLTMLEELGTPAQDEHIALAFLKARKKLKKYSHLFKWSVTTDALIKELLKKYQVSQVAFNAYYKTIPMEAIDELEKFTKAYAKIKKGKPVLSLIIDDVPEEKHENRSWERKKDPILLAKSPFGRWWFVLGAWDKEVAIVDELVYGDIK